MQSSWKVSGKLERIIILAVLHDTVEDGKLSLPYIQVEYGNRIAACVDDLTHKKGQSYKDYILDIGNKSPQSVIAIKIADLEDNMNLLRLASVQPEDLERINRYIDAWNYLTYNKNEI